MKSVFVNTICRGIGPAFDAIDTAASRLMLSDIDAAERNACCESIRVNADLLLSALDNMLEAANLDSLTEALRTPGGEEPEGLKLLRRMADASPRQVSDLDALEELLGRRLRISPSNT